MLIGNGMRGLGIRHEELGICHIQSEWMRLKFKMKMKLKLKVET